MKWLVKLSQLLLLLFLLMDTLGRSEDIMIPWNSTMLQVKHTFTVILGDEILFHPCGDSNSSNLVYTSSEEVYNECIPKSNITGTVLYNFIGDCINPSGKLKLLVKTGIPGVNLVAFAINETFYFLSTYMSECENGLKAIVQVAETRPADPESMGGTIVPETGSVFSPEPTTTSTLISNSSILPSKSVTNSTSVFVRPTLGNGNDTASSAGRVLAIAFVSVLVPIAIIVIALVVLAICLWKYKKPTQIKDKERLLEKHNLEASEGYQEQLGSFSSGNADSSNNYSTNSTLTNSTFLTPNTHALSVETDGPDCNANHKEASPPILLPSAPAEPVVPSKARVRLYPQVLPPLSAPTKPAIPSKPSVKRHPRELNSRPVKQFLVNAKRKRINPINPKGSPPVATHPSNNPRGAQGLPGTTSECKSHVSLK